MAKHKPIELMHFYYGVCSGFRVCAECCNFTSIRAGSKKLFKCKAYGATCSSGSDWAKKWTACGLFGNHVDFPVISDSAKHIFLRCGIAKETPVQIDGQIEIG